jgi:ubiquinone/menaquinone biosynthesis C-methylase UbiE
MTGGGWATRRWSLYAPWYDLAMARFAGWARRRAIALAGFRDGDRLLLVAAGTGLDLPHLPAGAHVVATDASAAMLARCAARAHALGREVEVRVMDAAALDVPDASFDGVVLHLALAVVPDPAAALREVVRVLRPGGRVSVFDKFLGDDAQPGVVRRALNALSWTFATTINRRLGPLLAEAGLRELAREPVGLGGLFVVAAAEKPPAVGASGPP